MTMVIVRKEITVMQIVFSRNFGHNYILMRYVFSRYRKTFTSVEFKSPSPWFGCSFVPWTWWALQNLMFKGKVCSIWTFNFSLSKFDICCLFWQNGAWLLVVGAWSRTRQQNVNKDNLKMKSWITSFGNIILGKL